MMSPRLFALSWLLSLASTTAGGASASAQENATAQDLGRRHLTTAAGTAVQAGGGIARFISSDPRASGGNGGYWDLRAVFGTRRFIGSELAYLGSVRPLSQDGSPAMLGHGVEAAFRINSVFETPRGWLLEPFSFMGVGWTRFARTGGTGHHVLLVPVGMGVALGRAGFLIDARLSYRPVLAGGELLTIDQGHTQLQSWMFGTVAGLEF
jgi:hypothetical protein